MECQITTEFLLVDAVAARYATAFRALAKQSNLDLVDSAVEGEGLLKVKGGGGYRLTEILLGLRLVIAHERDRHLAVRLLEEAERSCQFSKFIHVPISLDPDVTVHGAVVV